jgi:hypothetical protein
MAKKLTTVEFVKKAEKIHNGKYEYLNSLYKNSHDKIEIICKKHGSFWQIANDHLNGRGCSKCCGRLINKTTKKLFIERSMRIHGNLYDYSNLDYKSSNVKVKIICKIHGEFFQIPYSHWRGSGCPKCRYLKKGCNRIKTTDQFIKDSIKTHGNTYDYSKTEYKTSFKKVSIRCKKHGIFLKTPAAHIFCKQGCPKCRSSTGELIIMRWLEENKINYIPQKTFDDCRNPKTNYPLKYDFFIPSLNLLIEFDGKQHFESDVYVGKYKTTKSDLENTQFKDNIKTEYSERNGFKLIRIPFQEKTNIEKILSNKIYDN